MQLAQFLEFLENWAGDSLRAVQWYRGERTELIYLREGLDVDLFNRRVSQVHEMITRQWDLPEADLLDLGDRLSTVNVYEEVVLIHLPVEEKTGVVIGLEPIAVRLLTSFVEECREKLVDLDPGGDVPDRIGDAE